MKVDLKESPVLMNTIDKNTKNCFPKIRRILQFKIKVTEMPHENMANIAYSNVPLLHSNADSYQEFN